MLATQIAYFRIHKKYGDVKKPKRGPAYKLSTEDELYLVEYTNFCWDRNIPKTEDMLSPEICHYLDVEGNQNKFKHQKPGKVKAFHPYFYGVFTVTDF